MIRKNCEYCGEEFESYKSKNRKFCSKKCANSRKRPWRKTGKHVVCEGCGDTFYARKHRIENNDKLFCSSECQKIEIETKCDYCGKCFNHKPYRNRSYCSRDCSDKAGEYLKNGEYRNCKNCGQSFYTTDSDDQFFCSKSCHYESKREVRQCANCGESFKVRLSDTPNHCSRKCWKENAKTYPRTLYYRDLIRQKWQRESLHETYVKAKLQQSTGLSASDIPQKLIELKRLNIKRKRKLKQINKK